jgi:pilus assembly protein CpaF
VIGMEGDVIITQDLVLYDIKGEDANGRSSAGTLDRHRPAAFWDRARY